MLQNATPGAAAKEVIITTIDKRAALLEYGVSPGGLLLAEGQRLSNKGLKKKRRERKNRRKKRESTQWDKKRDCRIICVCAAYPCIG